MKTEFKRGQPVQIKYKGLVKRGIYKAVEKDHHGNRQYAIDIPSMEEQHVLLPPENVRPIR